ncbi:hypothetical protein E2C01_036212 [Portunus trituberculatus]|uniref:Uncharacterized protein n=1 Tax=Portunus trituberculatus TaxID=210409 RepID=A0A5B7FBG3_PORTR|nr:hypothetical protein [Portunus trituberculatus]
MCPLSLLPSSPPATLIFPPLFHWRQQLCDSSRKRCHTAFFPFPSPILVSYMLHFLVPFPLSSLPPPEGRQHCVLSDDSFSFSGHYAPRVMTSPIRTKFASPPESELL